MPEITQVIGAYLSLSLGDKDSVASIVSMLVGFASLATSIILGIVAWLQARGSSQADGNFRSSQSNESSIKMLPFLRMGDPRVRGLQLRVHPAVDVDEHLVTGDPSGSLLESSAQIRALDPDLPLFVDRKVFNEVCTWLRKSRESGGFLVLTGNSSTGKTRLLYEAAKRELSDFWLFAPDLGDGGAVNAISSMRPKLPGLIVWLDELQRYIPGPHFVSNETGKQEPLDAGALQRLLSAERSVVVVGTLWPEYSSQLRALTVDTEGGYDVLRYPQAVDLVEQITREIAVDSFSDDERTTAANLGVYDQRLVKALADPDYNFTEALAGASQIMRRYNSAPESQRAILDAAVDARRVGYESPIRADLLCTMARGYLSSVQEDDKWFTSALGELTTRTRRIDRATSPLIPVLNSDRTKVIGYTPSDYLLQKVSRSRRSMELPETAWRALVDNVQARDDMRRIAASAERRLVLGAARSLYEQLSDTGSRQAADRLAAVMAVQGDFLGLRMRAASGDTFAGYHLARALVDGGRVDKAIELLKPLAGNGHHQVDRKLVELLAKQGDTAELERRASNGDTFAGRQLAVYWSKHGNVNQLRKWVDQGGGNRYAARRLASILGKLEMLDELRARADKGDRRAARSLAIQLVKRGEIDELRARAADGDPGAVRQLGKFNERQANGSGERPVNSSGARNKPRSDGGARQAIKTLIEVGEFDRAILLLRDRIAGGDQGAGHVLSDLLFKYGRFSELRDEVRAGTLGAGVMYIAYLSQQNKSKELQALRNAGRPTDPAHS